MVEKIKRGELFNANNADAFNVARAGDGGLIFPRSTCSAVTGATIPLATYDAGHVGAEVGPVNKESSNVKTTDVRFARFNHDVVVVANSAIDAVPALGLGLLANMGSPPPTKAIDEPLSTT